MEPLKLADQRFLDMFGLGSLFILVQSLVDPSLVNVFLFTISQDQVPTALALVVASIAFFFIFAAGKLVVIFGSSLSSLVLYSTQQRYLDYLSASSLLTEREWALFSNLRRDLDFIDGILGIYSITIITMTTSYFVADVEDAFLKLSVWSILFMLLGIGMCLNGIWGNRQRVHLVIRPPASVGASA